MKNITMMGMMGILFFSILVGFSASAFADTVVTTTSSTYPYFHTVTNPFAAIFYFVGDVLALPFRLLGDLFS